MNRNILVVVDMQNGVFDTPRFDRDGRAARINALIAAADQTIFICHEEGNMQAGTAAWQLLPELQVPPDAIVVTKTACDGFWHTELAATLQALDAHDFVICGCATDYCVDTTLKAGNSRGYAVTVASDAHTTADRTWATAEQLIGQHNEVWAGLTMPGNPIRVETSEAIVRRWRTGG